MIHTMNNHNNTLKHIKFIKIKGGTGLLGWACIYTPKRVKLRWDKGTHGLFVFVVVACFL